MKVKMLVSMEGPEVSRQVNQIIDIEASEAERLINKGFAETVKQKVEKAVINARKANYSTRK